MLMVCINTNNLLYNGILTLGKTYDIIGNSFSGTEMFIGDNGKTYFYKEGIFITIEESRRNKIKEIINNKRNGNKKNNI